jgi:site-specific DNA-methyltransferase (adenine-specific)
MNDMFNENAPLKTETPAFAKHVLPAVPSSEVYLEDCVTALKRFSDNHFDLAIVDPPYGIDWMQQIQNPNTKANWKQYENKEWDKQTPTDEYWEQLFRVSKNQIVWGGNYMTDKLYPSSCWLIWDKMQEFSGAVFEMAWTSFKSPAKAFRMSRVEAYANQNKIHPTQKPVRLYDWILNNYAEEGNLILDTHLGSGSSRIASYKGGFNFVGFEIDQEYYEKQEKRFNDFKSQLRLF